MQMEIHSPLGRMVFSISECGGDAREEFLAVKNYADGVNEVIACACFGDVAPGAYIGNLTHHLPRIVHGEEKVFLMGVLFGFWRGGLAASHAGHADVQNQEVGT